ncbi:MAG: hypothetical protein ACR2IE_07105 [Candidatus Sumerlaeaceae bacterium]
MNRNHLSLYASGFLDPANAYWQLDITSEILARCVNAKPARDLTSSLESDLMSNATVLKLD